MSGGQLSIPDPESVHVKRALTGPITPAGLGAGSSATVIAGAVRSILSVTTVVARLPATSTASPVLTCPAPSEPTTTGIEQLAIPDPSSEHVKVTLTPVLFQSFELGGG